MSSKLRSTNLYKKRLSTLITLITRNITGIWITLAGFRDPLTPSLPLLQGNSITTFTENERNLFGNTYDLVHLIHCFSCTIACVQEEEQGKDIVQIATR
jgi:hypothetical protein